MLVYVIPGVRVAYRSPSAHVFIEAAAALIALLVAYLVLQRFRVRGGATSLLMFVGFFLLGLSSLAFAAVPAALPSLSTQRFSTWAALAGSLSGAGALAAAVLLPLVVPARETATTG